VKIAILGAAPSSRLLAPFNDPSWEIWACSPGNCDLPRIDYFFEIHAFNTTLKEARYADFVEWCKKHPKIYMQEKRPEYPGSIAYPKDEMLQEFGPYFWRSSVDYMMALAISKEPEAIGLWGVDMNAHDEYADQRPSCQHYIYEASRRGIKIAVPPETNIHQPAPMYGYREASHGWWSMNARKKELTERLSGVERELASLSRDKAALEGAIDDADYVVNTYQL
jgi:hypothetical protein